MRFTKCSVCSVHLPLKQAVQSRVPGCDISEEGKESTGRQLKLGQLHFRLKYNYEKHALCVTIAKCTELPPKESSSITSCDPYVKLQLLPDKQHKVCTCTALYKLTKYQ